DRGGTLVEVTGYECDSGILARGEPAEQIPLEEARELLLGLLDDFQFAAPGDRSRALAGIISPALIFGGLLPGRAPIDLGEANLSQAGKGIRNKITAAIYNSSPCAVTLRKRGVGGLEESFDANLISGNTFISLDNVRGHIDSP